MNESVFFELQFYALVGTSLILPMVIYAFLFKTKAISRATVLIFAIVLLVLSGFDIFLLKSLAASAKSTLSTLDDRVFSSELSIGFYLLPAVFGGIAVNLISHLLIDHLHRAERQFDLKHSPPKPTQIRF